MIIYCYRAWETETNCRNEKGKRMSALRKKELKTEYGMGFYDILVGIVHLFNKYLLCT